MVVYSWNGALYHSFRSFISPWDQASSINISSLGRLFGTLTKPRIYEQSCTLRVIVNLYSGKWLYSVEAQFTGLNRL